MSGVEARLAEAMCREVDGWLGDPQYGPCVVCARVAAALAVVVAEEVTAARAEELRYAADCWEMWALNPAQAVSRLNSRAARIARAAAPPSSIGSGVGGQGGVGHERPLTGPVSDQEGFRALPDGQASPRRLCDEEKR